MKDIILLSAIFVSVRSCCPPLTSSSGAHCGPPPGQTGRYQRSLPVMSRGRSYMPLPLKAFDTCDTDSSHSLSWSEVQSCEGECKGAYCVMSANHVLKETYQETMQEL